MGTLQRHLERYKKLKADATSGKLSEESISELLFVAAFHLIDACAAKSDIHIGGHQHVRRELEANDFVFEDDTETIWRLFRELERDLRPKFVYGFSWTPADFDRVLEVFESIEAICLEMLE